MEEKFLQERNINYSKQVSGRDKGCIESFMRYEKNLTMKEFNRSGSKLHGYKLGVSGASFKITTFSGKTSAQKIISLEHLVYLSHTCATRNHMVLPPRTT